MARKRNASRALNRQLTELTFAAPRVISHRVARMAATGGQLSAQDQRELVRMSSEKIAAAWQSWAAMAGYSLTLGADIALASAALWWPGLSRRRLPSAEEAAVHLANAAVRPYRRAVAANERRLGAARRRTP